MGGVLLVALVVFLSSIFFKNLSGLQNITFVRSFLFPKSVQVSSTSGRINIAVLGKGGFGHTAPDLTDTILVVSVPEKGKKTTLVSLPRDLWIAELRAKLNSTYYWGNQREDDGGLVLAKSTVEQIIGTPVHYILVVDFGSFKKAIDTVGGIDVDVENSFIDTRYPIPGRENDLCDGDREYACRYETIEFQKGMTHMDGEGALKFVRSRNASGDEGTDIAREARQQRVIKALEKKFSDPKVFLNPGIFLTLANDIKDSIETDMDLSVIAVVARKIFSARNFVNFVIPEDLILNPPISSKYDNQYVFIPRKGDWGEIHTWFRRLLNEN